MSWQDKVNRVIAKLSHDAWDAANRGKDGKRLKKHRPYSPPEEVRELVIALGDGVQSRGERRAKEIMESLRHRGLTIDDTDSKTPGKKYSPF